MNLFYFLRYIRLMNIYILIIGLLLFMIKYLKFLMNGGMNSLINLFSMFFRGI